jgi:hypothetical protein
MKKMHILVIFLIVFFLFACDNHSVTEDSFKIDSVEFGTENHQLLIKVFDNDKSIDSNSTVFLNIYSSPDLLDSALLYSLDNFTVSNHILTFTLLVNEQSNYLDDLYITIAKSLNDKPKSLLHTINLYELATTSSSEFATHIKNMVDGLTISSLTVLVNFTNYTITSCEHSISCDIATDYNKVTITIQLRQVIIDSNLIIWVNDNMASFTYNHNQKIITIIMDDPNWTLPY